MYVCMHERMSIRCGSCAGGWGRREVQDAVGHRQQGEQEGGSERGPGRENKQPRRSRGRIERGLSKHRENSSCVVHKSSKLEAIEPSTDRRTH